MGYSIATVKTNLSYTLLAAFLVSVTILPLRVHSTITFQDNFNLEPGGTSFTSITNWNATAGNFDVIGDGFFDIYPGNGKYIDMAGSTNATIETSTSILLNPGTHQLTFNLGTNLADNSRGHQDLAFGCRKKELILRGRIEHEQGFLCIEFTLSGSRRRWQWFV